AEMDQHGAEMDQHGAEMDQHGAEMDQHGAEMNAFCLPKVGKIQKGFLTDEKKISPQLSS
ncbi:hypothetical protein HMPREF9699_00838, partial [Bergeyella zoohelcum ATCC 43767]